MNTKFCIQERQFMKRKIYCLIFLMSIFLSACSGKEANSIEQESENSGSVPSASGPTSEAKQNDFVISPNQAFASVLNNEKRFICTDKVPYMKKDFVKEYYGYLQELPCGDQQMITPRFAVVDMDGDEIPEVILEIEDYWGFIILRYENENVYGNIVGYRTMNTLKKNGVFHSSSSSDEYSWQKLFFIGNNFLTDEMLYRSQDFYYANDIPIEQELWEVMDSACNNLQNVEWYEFTDDAIDLQIIKNPLFSDISAEKAITTDERQKYLESLSYLVDMTYDYTEKNQEERNVSAKRYYTSCLEEMDKIYKLCNENFSAEDAEALSKSQQYWKENIDRSFKSMLIKYGVNSIEDMEDQSLYYAYGDVVLRRTFALINDYFNWDFYDSDI